MRASSRFALLAALVVAIPARAQRSAGPLWTRGATCYEVFVRSFYDSDGDGIGDLRGLTQKLDYINDGDPRSARSLGARCIWLMPVAESPSYHGYDASDYYRIEHDYGTNDDFRQLVREAHRRGIRIVVDMVLNHSSNENPWFQAAARDTASPYRNWYRWSATKPDEKGPWGQDVWHESPVRHDWYYGVFWSGMPDLNYETPAVRAEAMKIARFWLDSMGVDGFRLDAVPYLMEDHGMKAGSPGTHQLLHDYAAYVDSIHPGTYTVGEVFDRIDAVLPYYPEQLYSYFGFEVADAIIEAARTGSARKLLPPVLRMQRDVPDGRWSPFQRNHDQPRTRTELGGDMARARVSAFLLLTMPGLPYVYYGEEIGMVGGKPDERIRTPMQWSRGAGGGFTRGRAWEAMQPDSATVNVEAQETDAASLLSLYRRLIHLRATNPALAGGDLVPLTASTDAVAAWLRRDGDRVVLVVANLGDAPADGVSLASPADALPTGCWSSSGNLLGVGVASPVRVGADGRATGWVPLRSLAPRQGYLFELTMRGCR